MLDCKATLDHFHPESHLASWSGIIHLVIFEPQIITGKVVNFLSKFSCIAIGLLHNPYFASLPSGRPVCKSTSRWSSWPNVNLAEVLPNGVLGQTSTYLKCCRMFHVPACCPTIINKSRSIHVCRNVTDEYRQTLIAEP